MPGEGFCSFCEKPASEVGPIVEGPDTGSGSVFICRACAVFIIEILDAAVARRRGEKPAKSATMARLEGDMVDICAKALDRFEALSKQRDLTLIELERKQILEDELKKLRSDA
jgi:ClpX C4-type zinc finger